jgi:xylose isomerase
MSEEYYLIHDYDIISKTNSLEEAMKKRDEIHKKTGKKCDIFKGTPNFINNHTTN